MMKIKIKPFMSIKKIMGDNHEVDIELENDSLRNLLEILFLTYGEELKNLIFDNKTKEIKKFYHLMVNGQSYLNLPGRLDAKLKEGDVIVLFPPVGGG